MPRVHFVKAARKPIPSIGVKVGDSYYWWKNRVGGPNGRGVKRVSKTHPRPSQLTMSEYLGTAYGIQEGLDDYIASSPEPGELADELRNQAGEVRSLGDEQQEKFDNMPDGLQQGDTGQLLEQRAQSCEAIADELERVADELDAIDVADKGDDEQTEDEYRAERVAEIVADLSWDWEG